MPSLTGTPEELAAEFRAYTAAGIDHLQLYPDPCTVTGIEALVATPLVDTPQFGWTGSLSLTVLHNEVTRMTTPSLYTTNDPIVQGYAFGGLWATPYTYADANHDGIIEPNEVQLGAFGYLGPPLPTFESALATEVRLPGHVTVSGTLDFRAGNRVWNYTEALRCLSRICRASQDPTAPLDVQAAAVAGRLTGGATFAAYAQASPPSGSMRTRAPS